MRENNKLNQRYLRNNRRQDGYAILNDTFLVSRRTIKLCPLGPLMVKVVFHLIF